MCMCTHTHHFCLSICSWAPRYKSMSWITHPMRATICSTICACWRYHKDFLYEREKSLHQLSMCSLGSGTGWYTHNHIRCPPMDLLTQQMSRRWSAERVLFLWSEVKAQHDTSWSWQTRPHADGVSLTRPRATANTLEGGGTVKKKEKKETKTCLRTWLEEKQDQRWLLSSLDPADSQVQPW